MDEKEKSCDMLEGKELRPGWSRYLVLAGAATTFGASVPVGFNIGVINTPAEIIKTFCSSSVLQHYGSALDDAQMAVLWAVVVSIFIFGGCIGSLCSAYVANTFGRKKATLLTSVLYSIGAALFLFCRSANSIEMLILGRFIVGVAAALTTSIVPMYLTELSPSHLAGAMGAVCPMGVNLGVLIAQVLGFDFILGTTAAWPYLLACFAVLVTLSIPILLVLPESPKYLYVVKKDEEAAIRELSRLRGLPRTLVVGELRMLAPAPGAAVAPAVTMWGLRRRDLRLPTLLVLTAQAGQQTTGITAIFYYSQQIFVQSGLSAWGAQLASLSCAGVNVATALTMMRLLPSCRRRPLLLGSVLSVAVLLATLCVAMLNITAVAWMPTLCAALVVLFVLVYGLGLGPIPYFIANELFETHARGAGAACGSLGNWAGNLVVGLLFPSLNAAVGAWSFMVFAGCTTALFLFQWRYLPETRGVAPAAVAELCASGLASRPTKLRKETLSKECQ